jgi:glycosyltransferase involved in cell wall biosynthesis
LPFFKKRSSVINAAVDYEKFYLEKKEIKNFNKNLNQKFIIGTVSCFKPQKNLIDLLQAFKKVLNNITSGERHRFCHTELAVPDEALREVWDSASRNIKFNNILLQIIGDGEQREYLQDFILKNNLQNNIELLGWQDNVAKFMHNWDLFALSSLWEGLPCVVVEARLAKLPVIAYKISGIPEVIFDNKNGFLIDSGNWEVLAEKIEFIIKDNINREKLSNYNDNLSMFNNNYMINEHLLLYKSVLYT